MNDSSLKGYIWLSIGAAVLTIALKTIAWQLTGSVGLLSDAIESIVNLAGALMALAMIHVAEQPADKQHPYGHGKAEYFSSAFEGMLILLAAVWIGITAIDRLRDPQPLQSLDIGIAVSVLASVINFLTARVLLKAGKKHRSMILKADGQHLMTDVWTSGGVVLGIMAAAATGWLWLDPVLAILVACNILWAAYQLLLKSTEGLMDVALSVEEQSVVSDILEKRRGLGVDFHALRMRESGTKRFIEFHVLVPGRWTVQKGHDLVEEIEWENRQALPGTTILTHLEPIEDPLSNEDIGLDR